MRSFLTRTLAVTALALAPMAVLAQGGPNPGNGPGAGRDGGPGMGRDGGQRGGEGAGARQGQGGGGGGRADAQGPRDGQGARGGNAMQRDDHGMRGDDHNADRGDRGDRARNADRDDHMRGGEMRRGDDDRGGPRDRVGERGVGERGVGERGMRRGPARVVTTEQRSRIRNVFRSRNIESIRGGDFAVRVGGVVPARYRFRPLPPDIVSFVPEYEGYDYIVVDDQILILDPEFHDIVAIIS